MSGIQVSDNEYGMREMIDRYYELNDKLRDKMYEKKAIDIFKDIPMKMDLFYERFDKECMNIPLFKYSDPYLIFQRISCASNEDIVKIREKLLSRAKKSPEIAKEEIPNMYKLCQIVDDYVSDKKTSIKIVVLKEFSTELRKLLDDLKDTSDMM